MMRITDLVPWRGDGHRGVLFQAQRHKPAIADFAQDEQGLFGQLALREGEVGLALRQGEQGRVRERARDQRPALALGRRVQPCP